MNETSNINENLVFILERQENNLTVSKGNSNDYVLRGIAAQFGVENNNSRIYEENEYLPHLEYLQEKIKNKRLLGELDHPEKFDVSLKNISHVVEELNYNKNGRVLDIKVRLLDTPAGKIAKSLVEAGIPLSISSRAAGNVGNDKKVQIKKIFTYDLVADPGFQDAQLQRVYESAGFSQDDIIYREKHSVISNLQCVNESFGINSENVKIYNVDNNPEFLKLMEKNNTSANMESNKDFVSAEDLNQYTLFLKKEMDTMKDQISSLHEMKSLNESNSSHTTSLEERVSKLEKYSDYLAESLDGAIKYGEYLAENLDGAISYAKYLSENVDKGISYSKYLAENLDKNISYSKYLAENLDKSITYSEYVAENVDKSITYSKYLAEKVDQGIQYSEYVAEKLDTTISYSEYLAENVDRNISYSEYIAEKLDQGIGYSEYLAEKVDQGIGYSEYLAEGLNKNISYSEYLAESVNKGLSYSDYLAEQVKNTIAYSEYIAENVNSTITPKEDGELTPRQQAELASKTDLFESGSAGDYTNLSSKIDSLIESVKTQKTDKMISEASAKMNAAPAKTQKADQSLNESVEVNESTTGYKFVDEAPEEYKKVWESLTEGHQQSLIAQSSFYNLETSYQIKNFWSTRQLVKTVGLQKLNEGQNSETQTKSATPKGYSSDYLNWVANSLNGKF